MLTAWRIVKARHAARAFAGDGARLYGGRWNSPGVAVVYLASTRSLAALEVLVHVDRSQLLAAFVLISCSFEERLVRRLARRELPRRWRQLPSPSRLAALGDRWVREAQSAVLAVPSAIIEGETNFLLNPGHPDSRHLTIGKPQRFDFDERLL